MAKRLSRESPEAVESGEGQKNEGEVDQEGFIPFGKGRVKFLELDAEKMAEEGGVGQEGFDLVWISEALSHIPGKEAFFRNAHAALGAGGKLVIADWFKGDVEEGDADIKAIEGMFLHPLLPPMGRICPSCKGSGSRELLIRGCRTPCECV